MNIQAFVKPYFDLTLVYDDQPLDEAVKLMTINRFTSIPIITREQKYVGTLTEGDILHFIINNPKCLKSENLKNYQVSQVKRHRDYETVSIDAAVPVVLSKASNENFVPVLDQNDKFIGIITRKVLLEYFFEHNFMVL